MRYTDSGFDLQPLRRHQVRLATSAVCSLSKTGTHSTNQACVDATVCGPRYACNGAGVCVQNQEGPYQSLSECKCYSCVNNACTPTPTGQGGSFASLQECGDNCGIAYKCATIADGGAPDTFTVQVLPKFGKYTNLADARCVSAVGDPGPGCECKYDATKTTGPFFNTVERCIADETVKCGWKYTCPVSTSWNVVGGVSSVDATMTSQGGTSCDSAACVYATYDSPKYVYFPIIVFQARASQMRITTSDVKAYIGSAVGNSTDFAEFQVVLIKWGNYALNQVDTQPATTMKSVSKTYGSPAVTKTVTAPTATAVAPGTPVTLTARGNNVTVQNFSNFLALLDAGWQYAVAVQAFIATPNSVRVSWGASSVKPEATA